MNSRCIFDIDIDKNIFKISAKVNTFMQGIMHQTCNHDFIEKTSSVPE